VKLSIVVPAYNEEQRIRPMLDLYGPFFQERYGSDAEILVVVNGSTDRTADVVQQYGKSHPQVRAIVEPRRIGKGGALLLGFREAKGEMVGFVDADGSTPPRAFQDLVERIGAADCIIANRWHKDSVISPKQPMSRRLSSRIFNGMVRLYFGIKTSDTQCGAKLMKREAIKSVLPEIGITRWAFDVDLLFQLRRKGYRIVDAPTEWHDVTGSRVRILRASTEMVLAMTRLRLLYSPFKWVVDVYDRTIGKFIRVHV
jgi:glycosyltransferase involved in cell wall biosynthesis